MSSAGELPNSSLQATSSTSSDQRREFSYHQSENANAAAPTSNGNLPPSTHSRRGSNGSNGTSAQAPHRPTSMNQNGSSRPPSSSRQAQHLAHVARRDAEQTNLQRPPSQHRRSSSMDRYGNDRSRRHSNPSAPQRTPSGGVARNTSQTRNSIPQPSPSQSQAYGDDASGTAATAAASTAAAASSGKANQASASTSRAPQASSSSSAAQQSSSQSQQAAPRKRTMITAQTGHWNLGKTIGAGSMGKVKIAKNQETGETCAIKIVPRYSQENEHRSREERERADHSKEVRTAREAAIVTLVNHPFICGMRDVVRTNYHWYMLFEYVNGGQMLDYIISHGRLKEKQARKFARQIGSALDYCHRNSIVHRDLKIENILISKTGDIKIIDFGLSNLFSPRNLLKTFCGSLYFAAPELLQARPYTGPEVDVWSFGIVLYVLVCGKVPFDDQSMPQLHAKIKKGAVEYPPWLSTECRQVISRMLVTDPRQRATLSEILNHPWMSKGYHGPPDNYLPHREPLQLPLDPAIIDKMTGFDFGSADYITRQLEAIIRSEDYQRVVRQASKKAQPHEDTSHHNKRSSVFDFYQRRKSATSKDTLTHSSAETLPLGQDPVNAYNPLLSVYYLVREKQDREKNESNPGATAMPQAPGEDLVKLPEAAPDSPFTGFSPIVASDSSARGKAFKHDDDLAPHDRPATQDLEPPSSSASSPPITKPHHLSMREHMTGGIFRKFSTRKNRDADAEKSKASATPSAPATPAAPATPSVSVSKPSESTSATPRASISVRRTRDPPSAYQDVANRHPDLLAPPTPSDDQPLRKGSKGGLGRSISVNSADIRRRWSLRRSSHVDNSLTPGKSSAGGESNRSSNVDVSEKASESQSDTEQRSSRYRSTGRAKSVSHGSPRESLHVRRIRPSAPAESDVPEETDAELAEEYAENARDGSNREAMKPVYLKGLFSVSTTSSRSVSYIRSEIIRVLKQLGVEYREIRGGFTCRHIPSIDLSKVVDPEKADQTPGRPTSHRRKISFAALRSNPPTPAAEDVHFPPVASHTSRSPQRRAPASSNYTTNSDDDSEEEEDKHLRPRHTGPRPAGETTTQVQSDLGQSMVLRFDILVIKVPILSLHGLQFKKVDGGTWQYKRMAETILNELRL